MKVFSRVFLFVYLLFLIQPSQAQNTNKPNVSLNHIALYVFNIEKSAAFYRDIIQLDTIAEPFQDGKHNWFKIGEHSQLHLIKGAVEKTLHDKNTHICFSVSSITIFLQNLKKDNIAYENWAGDQNTVTTRPDGVHQIYLKDPDGFWVEINDDNF
jgi:lactoylglutathione lyase